MKLLLHACCAPCSVYCVEALLAEGTDITLFWYNPNIHPYTEYRSRRDSLCAFAEEKKLPLVEEDEYGLRSFVKAVTCMDEKPVDQIASPPGCNPPGLHPGGRCAYCYRLRLEKTARSAAERSYDAFSTSLLISPYQNHDLIRGIGEELASVYGVKFFYRDFRAGFRNGKSRAKQAGYYMQKYCGCVFSEEERYLKLPGTFNGKT